MNDKDKEKVKEKVIDISCGLLAGAVDLVLFVLFQGINTNKYGSGSVGMRRSIETSVDEVASLGLDKETIKRAIWKATHKKFIKRPDRNNFEITKLGEERLQSLLPTYCQKRPWDGHFYLITYDISEKKRYQRRILREQIKKLGGGMLQDSVWLTPYNPKEILRKFVLENFLSGAVIISDIGKDGSIGDEDLDDLVSRIYHLDELNERYKEFIKLTNRENKKQLYFSFLNILQDDPQLPFEILPYGWMGDKAYRYLVADLKKPSNLLSGRT